MPDYLVMIIYHVYLYHNSYVLLSR